MDNMASLDVSPATTILVYAAEAVLPVLTGGSLVTTGTIAATTIAAAAYYNPLPELGQESSFLQRLRSQLLWLASILGLYFLLKYPISTIYIVLIATALSKTDALTDLPWFRDFPVGHVLLSLGVWFVASVLASLTEEAIQYATERVKDAVKTVAANVFWLVSQTVRCASNGVKRLVTMLVSKLISIPMWLWACIMGNQDVDLDGEESVDEDSEEIDQSESEVNPDAEDYEDEYQHHDKPDCAFYFEEEEDFGFLSEQQPNQVEVSTLRRSARLSLGGQEQNEHAS